MKISELSIDVKSVTDFDDVQSFVNYMNTLEDDIGCNISEEDSLKELVRKTEKNDDVNQFVLKASIYLLSKIKKSEQVTNRVICMLWTITAIMNCVAGNTGRVYASMVVIIAVALSEVAINKIALMVANVQLSPQAIKLRFTIDVVKIVIIAVVCITTIL